MTFIEHNQIQIAKTITVLRRLDLCIKHKKPFGLVRFGDGTIKAINSFLEDKIDSLTAISKQEGIPVSQFGKLINFWKTSANICNYIDSPEVYFSGKFWKRTKSIKKKKISALTLERLTKWKELYDKIGIINTNYCNPEINFLSCLVGKYGIITLPDLLKDKKICLVTSVENASEKLKFFRNLTVLSIVGKEENQYKKSFNNVIEKIDEEANDYDIWLIAAGELGRVYPGLIKFRGGRAFDIGSLVDYWCTGEIPSRLQPYLSTTIHNPLKLKLTEEGRIYNKYI